MHTPLKARAQGRWAGLLPQLGINARHLTGKHGPCPICGEGKDRFRFDDKEGRGTFFCSRCGSGDGVMLVMRVNGWAFKDAAQRVEALIGGVAPASPKPERSEDAKRAAMRRLWVNGKPIEAGDAAARWLQQRVGLAAFPPCLRAVAKARCNDDPPSWHPAMLARVDDPEGVAVNLHRTFLTVEGRKAPVRDPRQTMPGKLPPGSAVRLSAHQGVLGVAEGIETALAATALFGVPCWATLNAALLKQWTPPEGVREVVVFGDHDLQFGGQAAAFVLAQRLAAAKLKVRVEIPPRIGEDWNDILLEQRHAA